MQQTATPPAAILCILGGMAILGFSDNLLLYVTDESSLWQFHLLRSLFALVIIVVVTMGGYGALRPRKPLLVMGRSLVIGASMLIYFGCLAILPVGLVVAGFFTSPLFVALIAALFQGKRITVMRLAAILIGFIGVLCIIRPDPANLMLIAFLPVLAGLLYAIGAVATRAWCEGEGTLTLTTGFFIVLAVIGAVGCLILPGDGTEGFITRGWMPLTAEVAFWIALQAIGTLIGIMLLFRGYQLGEASAIAVFEYALLIFASGWAWYLWGQAIAPLGLVGMALIVVSGLLISVGRPRG